MNQGNAKLSKFILSSPYEWPINNVNTHLVTRALATPD